METKEFREALWTLLKTALDKPVYSEVAPASAKFPFVRFSLGPWTEVPSFQEPSKFFRLLLTVDVFSKAPTIVEADQILKDVTRILDRAVVHADGATYSIGLLSGREIYDSDNQVWIASADFSVHRR